MISTIFCEGKSEYNYIQSINRIMKVKDSAAPVFKPVDAGGGFYTLVTKKLSMVKKENRKGEYRIWVDKDIYTRNERESGDKYEQSENLTSREQEIPHLYRWWDELR